MNELKKFNKTGLSKKGKDACLGDEDSKGLVWIMAKTWRDFAAQEKEEEEGEEEEENLSCCLCCVEFRVVIFQVMVVLDLSKCDEVQVKLIKN